MSRYPYFINLSNGNRIVFLDGTTTELIACAISFGFHGIRSKKGKSLIIVEDGSNRTIRDICSTDSQGKLLIDQCDKIFIVYSAKSDVALQNERLILQRMNTQSAICYVDSNLVAAAGPEWTSCIKFYKRLITDDNFQISQIEKMRRKQELVSIIERTNQDLQRREEALLRVNQEIDCLDSQDASELLVKNIEKMRWIDKIYFANKIKIRSKSLQMSFVPNFGYAIPTSTVATNQIFYNIIKNQCLGYNFIALPETFTVPFDYNIHVMRDNNYKLEEPYDLLGRLLMFHGALPHIGPGGKCYGEFSSAVAAARDTGLDFLLMSFESFLKSANLDDSAGHRVVYLPMGDKDGNVTSWPLVDAAMHSSKIKYRGHKSYKDYCKILGRFDSAIKNKLLMNRLTNVVSNTHNKDYLEGNLQLIKSREPLVYERIMQRLEKGEIL